MMQPKADMGQQFWDALEWSHNDGTGYCREVPGGGTKVQAGPGALRNRSLQLLPATYWYWCSKCLTGLYYHGLGCSRYCEA